MHHEHRLSIQIPIKYIYQFSIYSVFFKYFSSNLDGVYDPVTSGSAGSGHSHQLHFATLIFTNQQEDKPLNQIQSVYAQGMQ